MSSDRLLDEKMLNKTMDTNASKIQDSNLGCSSRRVS
jgi:hypothetical protein